MWDAFSVSSYCPANGFLFPSACRHILTPGLVIVLLTKPSVLKLYRRLCSDNNGAASWLFKKFGIISARKISLPVVHPIWFSQGILNYLKETDINVYSGISLYSNTLYLRVFKPSVSIDVPLILSSSNLLKKKEFLCKHFLWSYLIYEILPSLSFLFVGDWMFCFKAEKGNDQKRLSHCSPQNKFLQLLLSWSNQFFLSSCSSSWWNQWYHGFF